MTTVYVVIVADRHSDPEPFVFSTPEGAIDYARNFALESAQDPGFIEEPDIPDGWLYHATYSIENDSVWVVEREVGP